MPDRLGIPIARAAADEDAAERRQSLTARLMDDAGSPSDPQPPSRNGKDPTTSTSNSVTFDVHRSSSLSSMGALTSAAGATEAAEVEHEEALPMLEDVQFNFERTFRYMTGRRLQRRYRGVYRRYSFVTQLVTWLIVIYTLSVLATLSFGNFLDSSKQKSDNSLADSTFTVVVIVVVVYVIVQVALLIRWIIYWAIVAMLMGYAATGSYKAVFWLDSDTLTPQQEKLRDVVVILFLVAEVLTIAIYIFTHSLYPWLVLHNKLDAIRWWNVRRDNSLCNAITYRSLARFYARKRNTIRYCGGLDDELRPHGYGMWTDSSYHGERLTGQWEHGIPVGPFRSFEHGSGYCFVNIRIGYCHNRAEEKMDESYAFPKHSSDGLHWGVASVECSVSGGFFKFLPSVTHLTPPNSPDAPRNAAECVPLLVSPTDAVVFEDNSKSLKASHHRKGLAKRFQSAKRLLFKESSCPTVDLADSNVEDERAALILLHGYNCPLDYSMDRLAQLLTLGDFPTTIHPFVFSWPSAGALTYFQAKTIGCESERTAADFKAFLQSLVDAGYNSIHLMAHSMGARIYFNCLERNMFEDVFIRVNEDLDSSMMGKRAQLATLTFLNPDYARNDFVKSDGGYDRSRRYCDCITLYADRMDGALMYSEIFTKPSLFGPLNYSMGKRAHMIHRDPSESNSMARQRSSEWRSRRRRSQPEPVDMALAIAMVNQQGRFDGVKSYAYNRNLQQPLELEDSEESGAPLAYLDMDVIDTTWMDNNVHSIRHNYFNINPTMVDDLRCLIVNKQRASSRPGLLKTEENVYIFLVAPSHVKNK